MVMEPKYFAEVIGYPNHHLRIWPDSCREWQIDGLGRISRAEKMVHVNPGDDDCILWVDSKSTSPIEYLQDDPPNRRDKLELWDP